MAIQISLYVYRLRIRDSIYKPTRIWSSDSLEPGNIENKNIQLCMFMLTKYLQIDNYLRDSFYPFG